MSLFRSAVLVETIERSTELGSSTGKSTGPSALQKPLPLAVDERDANELIQGSESVNPVALDFAYRFERSYNGPTIFGKAPQEGKSDDDMVS